MKKVILICPDQRPQLEPITGGLPLALAVYLGKPLVDHALDGLARSGVSDVLLLASDRPSDVRAYIGDGSAWGLNVRISPEPSELSPEQAAIRHASYERDKILTLDRLPQAPDVPIMDDVASWHRSRVSLLPLLVEKQIGAREVAPGIWHGLKARVSTTAVIHAPCWIGPNTVVGAHAVIGPDAFIESDSVIDAHATVQDSTVGTRTYLGSMTHLGDSIAAGPILVNWKNGSLVHLTDAFLLSHLDPPREALSSPLGRLLALLMILLTFPIPLILRMFGGKWVEKTAVLPCIQGEAIRTVIYSEIPSLKGYLRRWPYLWRIVMGDFAWVGNPPLNPEEAKLLANEFEQLWLQAGPGLFTAPEAEGCAAPWDDHARAHASLFACQPNYAWKRKIVLHGFRQLFKKRL